ncbi:MAG: 1-acyl-sn-glycerol-3-phosphate acyltransferase [Bacilli bacterium]|nr:1-acyl-sn-glycerol-3-phosphate acyltransferase [Bacilli bacterium]
MTKTFKMLSIKEEQNLSLPDLKKYYEDLREFCYNRKLTNTTPGATTIAPKLKEKTNEIASSLTNILEGENVEFIFDGVENIPTGPVIYAHTHQGLLDNFSWIPATPDHSIILHSSKVRFILKIAQLNTGLVLVSKNEKKKKNRTNATLDLITLGLWGHSRTIFPEAAYNLSPNKLYLPKRFGFLDVAKKSQNPVIPVVDEFTYDTSLPKEKITKIHIRFGKPIYVEITDNLEEKLIEYDEQIATMRWELISKKGLFAREQITNMDYINYLKGNLKNLKLGGINIDKERKSIFKSKDEFYIFNHLNDVPFDSFGNLLETEEIRRLKMINNLHGINGITPLENHNINDLKEVQILQRKLINKANKKKL